ncbi:hypothetical protein LSAT2_018448 [Lamellibrachia satsuma]|nr:hypothetical protein LSAT2_018448 [Lamellibrachia satsuma]
MTPKQKQWAVTEALYYGMPTVAMTQQRSCTPTSDHSALQGEGIDGSDSSSYWGAFPPKNDLRKSSSQGYLTSSRPGQQLDSPCTPLVHTAPLLPQQATDPETTGNSQTCTNDDANCAAGRTASSASWHHEHHSATNELPGAGDQRQLCHGKETQYNHTEPELIHNDIPESLPKPGLKPAIKSEETLMKTRNQRRWPRRRVTFSENIALISLADAEDSEAVDYMAYVTSTLVNRQHQSTSQGDVGACTVAPPSVEPQVVVAGVRTGSSDDAMAESVDWNASDKVQCMLCRKRLVDMTEVYCPDCQHYMSRFMPLISQC